MTDFDESIEDDIYAPNAEGRLCLKGWFDDNHDYLGHHKRMITATNKIKARRDFIDGNSTDS